MTDLPFTMTEHAISRALDMAVEGSEIRQAMLHPETIYQSKVYPDTMNYTAGRITIAVRDERVITIGWSSYELWHEDMAKGEYGGRTSRPIGAGR